MDFVLTDDYYMRVSGVTTPEDQEVLAAAPKAMSLLEFIEYAKDLPEEEKKDLPAEPTPGFYRLNGPQLKTMMKASAHTGNQFHALALKIVTPERAAEVRKLRCEKRHSWRALAGACHENWGGSWSPPTNQLMGMALCEVAAEILKEDNHELPWNDL